MPRETSCGPLMRFGVIQKYFPPGSRAANTFASWSRASSGWRCSISWFEKISVAFTGMLTPSESTTSRFGALARHRLGDIDRVGLPHVRRDEHRERAVASSDLRIDRVRIQERTKRLEQL